MSDGSTRGANHDGRPGKTVEDLSRFGAGNETPTESDWETDPDSVEGFPDPSNGWTKKQPFEDDVAVRYTGSAHSTDFINVVEIDDETPSYLQQRAGDADWIADHINGPSGTVLATGDREDVLSTVVEHMASHPVNGERSG